MVNKDKDEPQRGNGIIWAPLPVMGVTLATPVRGAILSPVWCSKRASFGADSGIQETSFLGIPTTPFRRHSRRHYRRRFQMPFGVTSVKDVVWHHFQSKRSQRRHFGIVPYRRHRLALSA